MSSDGPVNPFGALAAAALAAHEMFSAYLEAGFTRAEALHLVTAILVAGTQNQQPPPRGDQPPGG